MKKVFYPRGIMWFFNILLLLSIIALTVIYIIIFKINGAKIYLRGKIVSNWVLLILLIVGAFFLFCDLIHYLTVRIEFREGEIYTPKEKCWEHERIQYQTKINYSEISEIKVIVAAINSKGQGKTFYGFFYSAFREDVFFEFTLSSNKKKRLWLYLYSKKQRKKMLDIINEKIGTKHDYNVLRAECQTRIKNKKQQTKEKRKNRKLQK